jgi:WD40 repeat protein
MRGRRAFGIVAALFALGLAGSVECRVASGAESVNVRKVADLATTRSAVAVAWAPDGSGLVAASDYGNVLTVWDRDRNRIREIRRAGGGPTLWGSVAFINGSTEVVFPPPGQVENRTAFAVWSVASGDILAMVDGPEPGGDYSLNRAQHFMATPNQQFLAVSTSGSAAASPLHANVIVYETRSWKPVSSAKISPRVGAMCVFGGGRLIAAGDNVSGDISVLDLSSGNLVSEIKGYQNSKLGVVSVSAIAGSPAGDLVMSGVGTVTSRGGAGTPEERASWASGIEPVRLYSVKSGQRVGTLAVPQAPIRQAKWDPRGRFVAFVDNARGLFFWSPWSGGEYQKLVLPSGSLSLDISSDGEQLAVATDQGIQIYAIN